MCRAGPGSKAVSLPLPTPGCWRSPRLHAWPLLIRPGSSSEDTFSLTAPSISLMFSHSTSQHPVSLMPLPFPLSASISFIYLFPHAPTLESKLHKNRNFCLTHSCSCRASPHPWNTVGTKYLLTEEIGRNIAIRDSQSKYMVPLRRRWRQTDTWLEEWSESPGASHVGFHHGLNSEPNVLSQTSQRVSCSLHFLWLRLNCSLLSRLGQGQGDQHCTLPGQAGLTEASQGAHFQIPTGWCSPPSFAEGTKMCGSLKPSLGIFIWSLLHPCLPPGPKEPTFLSRAPGPCRRLFPLWEPWRVGGYVSAPVCPAVKGFPGCSVVKNPPASAGDAGLFPGVREIPRGGSGNPLQYSCLENPMDRRAWWATVRGVTKSQTT